MKLFELAKYLDEYLSCPLFSDYGPNGIQVEGKKEIENIATAVTANLETIEAALAKGFDALIVHHGLFWNSEGFCITGSKRKKLKLLLENEISLLAYHLPLDAHQVVGNNWKAAKDLGWDTLEVFEKIGVKGKFPAIEVNTFIAELEAYYQHPIVAALGGKKEIRSAALVSGGAYKYLKEAASQGVDAFITGNYDEPAWWMAKEEGTAFFSLGHSATERVGPMALARHLSSKFGIRAEFIDVVNPF